MLAESARSRLLCIFLSCVAPLLSLALARGGEESTGRETNANSPQSELKKFFLSADSCKRCHNEEKPKEDEALPSLCRLTEIGRASCRERVYVLV